MFRFSKLSLLAFLVLRLSVSFIAAPIDAPQVLIYTRTAVARTTFTHQTSRGPGPNKQGMPLTVVDSPDITSEARKQNANPNRKIPQSCERLSDCKCPAPTGPGPHATSCSNGFCICNDQTAVALGNSFLDAVAAIGNAPITKAVSNLMKGLGTVKDVAGTIVGAVLPPHMRAALEAALNALPYTGPSFLDDAKKKVLTAGL